MRLSCPVPGPRLQAGASAWIRHLHCLTGPQWLRLRSRGPAGRSIRCWRRQQEKVPPDKHQWKAEQGDLGTPGSARLLCHPGVHSPRPVPVAVSAGLGLCVHGCPAPLSSVAPPALSHLARSPHDLPPARPPALPGQPSARVPAGAPGGPACALPAWALWCVCLGNALSPPLPLV